MTKRKADGPGAVLQHLRSLAVAGRDLRRNELDMHDQASIHGGLVSGRAPAGKHKQIHGFTAPNLKGRNRALSTSSCQMGEAA